MTLELFENILLVLLVLVSLALVGLVLLQQGRGANVGAAFGGGAGSVFGSVGPANFLQRLTTWMAVFFFLITFGLAYVAKEQAVGQDEDLLPEAAPQGSEEGVPGDVPFDGLMTLDEDVPPAAPGEAGDEPVNVPEVPDTEGPEEDESGASIPG